ncbi:MAG: M48 family metallopeptidase [Candidatus Omnitrophica bacterium]|nr:M48 family metallopeptidase [Candidatus Omnitrophota bacterium]MCK5493962.1 M48 family metallopeptidase [Candidatus Omnitrophota bacterium]
MVEFEYTLIRKTRRKNLSITISSDNKIIVKAAKFLSEKFIETFLENKAGWIRKRISFNKQFLKPYIAKEFIEGENFLYQGKIYPLVLKKIGGSGIVFKDNAFFMDVFNNCKDRKRYFTLKFIEWYKIAAYRTLLDRICFYESILMVSISDLRIKTLKRTWGSCSKNGLVSFSWKIIMAPLEIIDYLVVHELCHLIHHDHSIHFWEKVRMVLPDYKKRKKWLAVHENQLNL